MPRRNRANNRSGFKWAKWRRKMRHRIAHHAGYRCHYCGRTCSRGAVDEPESFTLDHRVPLSRGGSWHPSNLVCACRECNLRKGTRTEAEYMMEALPLFLKSRGR